MNWLSYALGVLTLPALLIVFGCGTILLELIFKQFKTNWQKEAEYFKTLYQDTAADNYRLRMKLNPPKYVNELTEHFV